MKKPTMMSDADIFLNVTNDDQYLEAQVRRELKAEKEELEHQKEEIERNLKMFEEKVKTEKAKKLFTDKKDFLIREQLDRMENFIVALNSHLKDGNKRGVAVAMRHEICNIYAMNNYLAHSEGNKSDILYDYGSHGSNIYKKIKENNADFTRTNEKLGQIEVREADWISFPSEESGDKSSGNN